MAKPSILKLLCDERVLCVDKQNNGWVQFTEACDNYFSVVLSPDDVKQLAAELLALVNEPS
jgi:hypothetical protein